MIADHLNVCWGTAYQEEAKWPSCDPKTDELVPER